MGEVEGVTQLKVQRFSYMADGQVIHLAFFLGRLGAADDYRAATRRMGRWYPGQVVRDNILCSDLQQVPS